VTFDVNNENRISLRQEGDCNTLIDRLIEFVDEWDIDLDELRNTLKSGFHPLKNLIGRCQ